MPSPLRNVLGAVLAASLLLVPAPSSSASGAEGRYVGGNTAAVRADGKTVVDEGGLVCGSANANHVGSGGMCLPFGGGNAVYVFDAVAGENVAFQVCIDNNGDGFCTSPDSGPCADVVQFSHADDGSFFNPVGPLPTGFTSGCGAGGYNGYVVFLCEGAHVTGTDLHAHPAVGGTGLVTTGGEGSGDFCGGQPAQPARKPYRDGDRPQPPCRVQAVADVTNPSPQTQYDGVIEVGPARATDYGSAPGDGVSVECVLVINGVVPGYVIGTASGTGVASNTHQLTWHADPSDDVVVCAEVTVSAGFFRDCAGAVHNQAGTADVVVIGI